MSKPSESTTGGFGVTAKAAGSPLSRRLPTLVAVGVLLVGIVVTLVMTQFALGHARTKDEQHFNTLVERVQTEISRQLDLKRYGLVGTRTVFDASNYVDHAEFRQTIESLNLEEDFPGVLAIGYADLVPEDPASVDAFVQKTRAEGVDWFDVTVPPGGEPMEDAQIPGRMIIKYIEPLTTQGGGLGLDIGAHATRRVAAERAARTGEPSVTGVIQLFTDEQKKTGFAYILPFYENGMPIETEAQRLDAIRGWVCMGVVGPEIFEHISEIVNHELDVEIFGCERLHDESLLYDSNTATSLGIDRYQGESIACDSPLNTATTIPMGGHTWTITASATPAFHCASRAEVWMTGIVGALLTMLLSLLVYIQGNSSRRAWGLAENMTADLREYATQAEQATQAKSDFLANMSHEIRTPMTAILGFTDVLQAQLGPGHDELQQHTQTIKRNGEHLLSLINDILDMSKIEAGKLHVEQIAVRPDAVISEVLSLMRVKADEKQLPFHAELLTPIPREILGDPVRLRQVLVNLVGNAIKFTEQGSVSIQVRFDEAMEELKFAVIDTGIGMTEEQTDRLFGAFSQADTTTTRQFGGTGLGLHISRRLATMLGGNIVCNSTYGQGSTFTLTIYTGSIDSGNLLPAGPLDTVTEEQREQAPRVAEPDTAQQNAPADRAADAPPLDGVRILLAEDGKDNQRLINHHLTKAGATVTIVENGKLAVETLCENNDLAGPLLIDPPFDLIITDMQMPEMDGYTEARLLREKSCQLPIIALTAHAMTEDVNKCLEAGCDYYASKPIDKQKLIALCQEACRTKQTKQGKASAA